MPQVKDEDHIRILLQNVGGLGKFNTELNENNVVSKLNKIENFVISKQVDLLGITETNTDWRMVEAKDQFWKQTRPWFRQSRSIVTYNNRAKKDRQLQWGGTAMLCANDLCSFENGKERGRDTRGLGRWTWMTLEGKMNRKITFITAYCPTNNNTGLTSTQSQQQVYINKHLQKHDTDHPDFIAPSIDTPRKMFGHDLSSFVKRLQDNGHLVWIMGDFNSEYSELQKWMLELDLVDIIGKRHGHEALPRTHTRSKNRPIDAIFAPIGFSAYRCGYLRFGQITGDHRGLWLDIPKQLLFGCKIPKQVPAIFRRLQLDDPRVVEKYNLVLKNELQELNVYDRIFKLYREATYPLSDKAAAEYEKLDQDIVLCQETAEKKCRKLHTGTYEASPILTKAYNVVNYWERRLEYVKGNRRTVSARDLINIQRRLGITFTALSVTAVAGKLKEANRHLVAIKKNAKALHISHREQLAAALEERGNISAAKHIKIRLQREKQRDEARSSRYMLNKLSSGATTKVQLTDEQGRRQEYTEKNDVENIILAENEKKYHQTEGGTQLLNPEFIERLGKYGEGPDVDDVLNGDFHFPQGTSQATKDFIEACRRVEGLPEPDGNNVRESFKAYIRAWKLRKEKTNSANQHMGHYKAGIQDEFICTILYMRSEIPVVSGYSPKRWRQCVDLMILKKAMNFDINKQRTLALLDTELNQCNKRLQREAIKIALSTDQVAPEQYSRPGRDCKDHALNRRLTVDTRHYERKCFSLAMSDLSGCYDRIVHTAAALALLRLGLKKASIYAMFESIQRMVHKVRTGYGDSSKTYGGDSYKDWKNAPQGVLQGNAAGPVIWAILSSVIFSILRDKGYCDSFCMCLSRELFELVGFAFVDDADMIQSGKDADEVLEKTQELITEWRDLMEVTGGAIETKKSYFYIIDYKKQKGKWMAYDPDIGGQTLFVKDKDDRRCELARLPCDEAAEMLGVWMAMNGNREKQIEELKVKVKEWTFLVQAGNCTQEVIWHTFQTTITKQIEYVLLSHTLTEKECTSILAPAIIKACQKSGYSARFRRVFRQTSSDFFGAGAMDIFQQSGLLKLSALVMHSWKDSPTKMLLQTNVENFVMEAGLYGNIWNLKSLKKALDWCSPHSWIYNTAQFLVENDISIRPNHFELKPNRFGDKSIMDLVAELPFTKSQLRHINEVRMAHGVVSVSDIATADGSNIDQAFLHKSIFEGKRNNFVWPSKIDISSREYDTWIRAMHYIFPQGRYSGTPLLHWQIQNDEEWIHNWNWFRSTDGLKLLYQEDGIWVSYAKHGRSRTRYSITPSELTQQPNPAELVRITVEYDRDYQHVTSASSLYHIQTKERESMRLGRYTIWQPKIPYLFQFIKMSDSIDRLLEEIAGGTAVGVGDGSYYENKEICTCGWILCTKDGQQWIKGGGILPGLETDLNSYRGEVGSLTGLVNCIEALSPCLQDTTARIVMASDNDSAVDCLYKRKFDLKASTASLDLVSSLVELWQIVPYQPIPTRVKGHADELHRPLTFLETLNCIVDEYAKDIAQHYFTRRPPTDFTREVGISDITIGDMTITSNLLQSSKMVLDKKRVCEYWSELIQVPARILEKDIGWTSIRRARKERSFKQNRFITKFIADDLPIGKNLVERKHSNVGLCPCCKRELETNVHVLTCPEVKETRDRLLTEMQSYLHSIRTEPLLLEFLLSGIRSWLENPDNGVIPVNIHYTILDIAQKQNAIGWYSTLLGFIHKDVIVYQQQHYDYIQSRRTGISWAKHVTKKFWNFIYQMWAERNRLFHNTTTRDEFQGLTQLETSIRVELNRGLRNLPNSIYQHHFNIQPDEVTTMTTSAKKAWLLLIRSAREAHMDAIIDDFSHNDVLREWIGLDPECKEFALDETIIREYVKKGFAKSAMTCEAKISGSAVVTDEENILNERQLVNAEASITNATIRIQSHVETFISKCTGEEIESNEMFCTDSASFNVLSLQWLKEGQYSSESLKLIYLHLLKKLPYYSREDRSQLLDAGIDLPDDSAFRKRMKKLLTVTQDVSIKLRILGCNNNDVQVDLMENLKRICPNISIQREVQNTAFPIHLPSSDMQSLKQSYTDPTNEEGLEKDSMNDSHSFLSYRSDESSIFIDNGFEGKVTFRKKYEEIPTTPDSLLRSLHGLDRSWVMKEKRGYRFFKKDVEMRHVNAVVLYLNEETFQSSETILDEIREIKDAKIPIILVHEKDIESGACDFELFFHQVPGSFADEIFADIAIPLYKRKEYREISLNAIVEALLSRFVK